MPDTTTPITGIDAAALSTPEALRVAVLYLSAEVHMVREDLARRGTIGEEDRQRLSVLESKADAIQRAMEQMNEDRRDTWFDRIIGQSDEIDNAKRPLLRLVVLTLAVAVALVVLATPFAWLWYTSDAQQQRRDERERRAYVIDSLRHAVPRLQEQVNENRAVTDSAAAVLDSLTAAPTAP